MLKARTSPTLGSLPTGPTSSSHFLPQASGRDVQANLLTEPSRAKGNRLITRRTLESPCHLTPCPQCAPATPQACFLSYPQPTKASPPPSTPLQADTGGTLIQQWLSSASIGPISASPNVLPHSSHTCHILSWGQGDGSLLFPQSH